MYIDNKIIWNYQFCFSEEETMKERVFSAFIYNCNTKEYECMMEWINPHFAKYMLKHIVHDMFYTVCEGETKLLDGYTECLFDLGFFSEDDFNKLWTFTNLVRLECRNLL